jgi:AraC family transcriptional regulator of arabinose operon
VNGKVGLDTPALRDQRGGKGPDAGVLGHLDVQVLAARRVDLAPGGWDHPWLPNRHWRLYQHDRGGGRLLVDGAAYGLEPERVYLIPPHRRLASRCEASFRQFYIHFDLTGLPSVALGDLFPGPIGVPASPPFEASVAELGAHVGADWRGDMAFECWIRGVISEAIGRYLASVPPDERERYQLRLSALQPVLPALRRIEAGFSDRLINVELAALCSLSEDHFIRRFAAATGLPPARFIARRRVALAAQLLLYSDQTLEQIAERTGFRDRFYFSRVFTRETGTAPGAFRRGGPA